jgi:hypothetical protein
VIPKIPEDVMTLVPPSESGNTAVKSLDNRRVYEVIGGGAGQTAVTDFEGRELVRAAHSLKISGGPAARVTVRWRFGAVAGATVNGAAVPVESGADGPFVEFAYLRGSESRVEWQDGPPIPQVPPASAPSPQVVPGAAPAAAPAVAAPAATGSATSRSSGGASAAKASTTTAKRPATAVRSRSRSCRKKPCRTAKSSSAKPAQ